MIAGKFKEIRHAYFQGIHPQTGAERALAGRNKIVHAQFSGHDCACGFQKSGG
jgi:hypothetical protein